jgi:hypothetical protein
MIPSLLKNVWINCFIQNEVAEKIIGVTEEMDGMNWML